MRKRSYTQDQCHAQPGLNWLFDPKSTKMNLMVATPRFTWYHYSQEPKILTVQSKKLLQRGCLKPDGTADETAKTRRDRYIWQCLGSRARAELLLLLYVLIRVTLSQNICCRGTWQWKQNEKKLSPQSVLNVKWQWKQRWLQFPAKQLLWWRSPDRRRQAVPGACSRYRKQWSDKPTSMTSTVGADRSSRVQTTSNVPPASYVGPRTCWTRP